MFCGNCGFQLENTAAFCPNCGTPTGVTQNANTYQQNAASYQPGAEACQHNVNPYQNSADSYQQNANPYQQNTDAYQQNTATYQQYAQDLRAPELSMGWFKFLIYFALFAGAVLNLIQGVNQVTGSVYGAESALVYATFGDLRAVDIIVGVLCISLAVFGIITRFSLAGYKKSAPTMIVILYAGVAAVNIIYMIGVYAVLPSYVMSNLDLSSSISSTGVAVAMTIVNGIYFNKRKHLFVK